MIRRAGYEIWYEPASTIYHKESQTTGQASPLRTYYISRNRLLFVSRNGSGLYKYLSYCYLTFVVAMRDIAMYTLKGRTDLAKSAVRGIVDFFKMK
jgi:GT2 family glycosyltransferase